MGARANKSKSNAKSNGKQSKQQHKPKTGRALVTTARRRIDLKSLDARDAKRLAELEAKIREGHKAAEAAIRRGMEHAIEVGNWLLEAQTLMKENKIWYGHWQNWVRENCGFSIRTAQYYLKVARYLQAMPDYKDFIIHNTLASVGESLQDSYRQWVYRKQLLKRGLWYALCHSLSELNHVFEQIQRDMGDDDWNRWFEQLNERQKIVVLHFTDDKVATNFPLLPQEYIKSVYAQEPISQELEERRQQTDYDRIPDEPYEGPRPEPRAKLEGDELVRGVILPRV